MVGSMTYTMALALIVMFTILLFMLKSPIQTIRGCHDPLIFRGKARSEWSRRPRAINSQSGDPRHYAEARRDDSPTFRFLMAIVPRGPTP